MGRHLGLDGIHRLIHHKWTATFSRRTVYTDRYRKLSRMKTRSIRDTTYSPNLHQRHCNCGSYTATWLKSFIASVKQAIATLSQMLRGKSEITRGVFTISWRGGVSRDAQGVERTFPPHRGWGLAWSLCPLPATKIMHFGCILIRFLYKVETVDHINALMTVTGYGVLTRPRLNPPLEITIQYSPLFCHTAVSRYSNCRGSCTKANSQ